MTMLTLYSARSRLHHLNQLYCTIYPSLRYMTFVAGRPRAAIVPEMERLLSLDLSPAPLPDGDGRRGYDPKQPGLEDEAVRARVKPVESEAWKVECERGLGEVFKIGRARLSAVGLQ